MVLAQTDIQAAPTKVKLSLGDFILSKKKLCKEMEPSKSVQASPLSVSSTLGAEGEGVSDAEVGVGADGGYGHGSEEEKGQHSTRRMVVGRGSDISSSNSRVEDKRRRNGTASTSTTSVNIYGDITDSGSPIYIKACVQRQNFQ